MKKRIMDDLHGHKVWIYLSSAMQILDMALLVCIMFAVAYIINHKWVEGGQIPIYVIYLVIGFILLKCINMYATQLLTNSISRVYTLRLRESFHQKVLSMKETDREKLSSTNFLVLYSEGIKKLANFVAKSIPFNYASIANIIVLFSVMILIHWKLGLTLVFGSILVPLGMRLVRGAAKRIVSDKWKSYINLSENFLDNLNGLKTLKIYQSDAYKHEEMNKLAEDFRVKTMKSLSIRLHSITIMEIVTYVGMGFMIILSVMLKMKDEISYMHMIFAMLISSMLFIPARQLGTYAHAYRSAQMLAKKIYKVMDLDDETAGGNFLDEQIESLELSDLSFGYTKEKGVLSHVNMRFDGSGLYAIVGKSGSGKSTILKALFHKINYQGQIVLNHMNIKEIASKQLAKRIVAIAADDFVFKGTVRKNLSMAAPNLSDTELEKMLKKVRLDFNLDFLLESNAKNISVGQRQRFILARALLLDADVYLLDEILSGVDIENESMIMQVLKEIARTKIMICVTHRLTSIKEAKTIYFLEEGFLKETGSHHKLYASRLGYYQLYEEQNKLIKYGDYKHENI